MRCLVYPLFAMVAIGVTVTACAPVAAVESEGPRVALINAPAEQRLSVVADELEEQVSALPSCCSFSFVRSQPVRFQETHRDMFGSRAAPQSAALARNLEARWAVMAAAPVHERQVEAMGDVREVSGRVQLRAIVLDAASGEQVATVSSRSMRDTWVLGRAEELPDIDEDPRMRALVERAAVDLAPHLLAVLEDLAAEVSGSSS